MSSPTPSDIESFVLAEIQGFFRAESRTSLILLILGVLCLVGGYFAFLQNTMMGSGMASALLLFGGLYVFIFLQTYRRIPAHRDSLHARILEHPQVAKEEIERVGRLRQKWDEMHRLAVYGFGFALITAVVSAFLDGTTFIFGLGLMSMVQGGLCVVFLLTSKFRLQLYQHALSKLSN